MPVPPEPFENTRQQKPVERPEQSTNGSDPAAEGAKLDADKGGDMGADKGGHTPVDKGGHTPERSLAQRLAALKRANTVRSRRATLKQDLKAKKVRIEDMLKSPPEYLQTAKVNDLLLAVPKFGRVKVNRVLTHCRISPSKTIGGLSQRQRDELVSYLSRR